MLFINKHRLTSKKQVKLDLIDISPSLLAIMGSNLNFNNNGIMNLDLLIAFGITDASH